MTTTVRFPDGVSALFDTDANAYIKWARDLGFVAEKTRNTPGSPFLDEKVHEWLNAPEWKQSALWRELFYEPPSLRDQVDEWFHSTADRTHTLWKLLVPRSGCADTVQGELVRAIGRIESEYYRNGNMNWDGNYFKDLSSFILRTLKSGKTLTRLVKMALEADIAVVNVAGAVGERAANGEFDRLEIFGGSIFSGEYVENAFKRINAVIVVWCDRNPDPIPYSE
jgi:hypothetical protein